MSMQRETGPHARGIVLPPGGYERFFEELAQLPPGPPDMAKFQAIFEKYDQETVELPPAEEA